MFSGDRADRLLLVTVEMRMLRQLEQMAMEKPFIHRIRNADALGESPAQGHKRPGEQRTAARPIEAQEPSHLSEKPWVCERVGGELVAQEVADDALGEDNWIQHGRG